MQVDIDWVLSSSEGSGPAAACICVSAPNGHRWAGYSTSGPSKQQPIPLPYLGPAAAKPKSMKIREGEWMDKGHPKKGDANLGGRHLYHAPW